MEEIKQHCEKVIQILRSDYNNELPDIHWNSIARCFADETTDYQSPVLFEIDKIAKLTEEK